jgi:hypothetical protein
LPPPCRSGDLSYYESGTAISQGFVPLTRGRRFLTPISVFVRALIPEPMQLQSGIVLISRKRSSDLSKLTKRAQRSANKHSDPGFFRRVSEQYTATTQGMKASIPKSYFAVSKREHRACSGCGRLTP